MTTAPPRPHTFAPKPVPAADPLDQNDDPHEPQAWINQALEAARGLAALLMEPGHPAVGRDAHRARLARAHAFALIDLLEEAELEHDDAR